MRESQYQSQLIDVLHGMFPGCFVLKNDSGYRQGIPDLLVLYRDRWAALEVKGSENAPVQPNQEFYIYEMNEQSFAAFIYPENEREVLDALQRSFAMERTARFSQR
jgi:hypothetical protein